MEENKSKVLAIVSLVIGVVLLLLGCCVNSVLGLGTMGLSVAVGGAISIVPSIAGLVISVIAMKKIKQGLADGKGMALAGLIINVFNVVGNAVLILVGVFYWLLLGMGYLDI